MSKISEFHDDFISLCLLSDTQSLAFIVFKPLYFVFNVCYNNVNGIIEFTFNVNHFLVAAIISLSLIYFTWYILLYLDINFSMPFPREGNLRARLVFIMDTFDACFYDAFIIKCFMRAKFIVLVFVGRKMFDNFDDRLC